MLSKLTLRILKHFAVSVNPTISSGEQILTKGKSEFLATCAAKAVLPEFGGPSINTDTRPKIKKDNIYTIFCINKQYTNLRRQ